MQISFTGIRNATAYSYIDNGMSSRDIQLSTQLKDDENGKDLSEYKQLIKKFPDFQHEHYSNFIHISTMQVGKGDDMETNTFLNGNLVPENDKYLPIFSYIGKLTKKISNLPNDKFPVDEAYKRSDFAKFATIYDEEMLSEELKELNYFKLNSPDEIYQPENVKGCANEICKNITNCMMEYFA